MGKSKYLHLLPGGKVDFYINDIYTVKAALNESRFMYHYVEEWLAMDLLYALFYTAFSMSCMFLVLLPAVLVLRFFFRHLSGRITLTLWMVAFLRAVCPVGMSSPVCIYDGWNRAFHTLLRSLGLDISPDIGLLTGWRYVFMGKLTASGEYKTCTVIWLAGAVIMVLGTFWKQYRLKSRLRHSAKHLYDEIYQVSWLDVPVRTGIFRKRIYLPEGFRAKELKDVADYQKCRLHRRDDRIRVIAFMICCIHWWNPGIWLAYYLMRKDADRACDMAFLYRSGIDRRMQCVQILANMQREKKEKITVSLITGCEKNLSRRAERLLYYEKGNVWKHIAAGLAIFLIFFVGFCLSSLQSVGRTGNGDNDKIFAENVQKDIVNKMISQCEVQTASGSAVSVELVVNKGTYREDTGYRGKCLLRLKDTEGSFLAKLELSKVFNGQKEQSFRKDIALKTVDYNSDGNMELAIGQKSGDGYEYYIINIEDRDMEVISPAIVLPTVTLLQEGSMEFSYIQDAGGVITISEAGKMKYYVWDASAKMYESREMTDDDIEKRREKAASEQTENPKNYSLDDNGKKVMDVSVKAEKNGGLSIQKIRINAKGLDQQRGTKTLTGVDGYYCDLQWAQTDGEEKRFAVLSYNGVKGRTFSLFDLKQGRLCYKPKDGNKILIDLFKKYGADDVTFDKDGEAVYSLMEIEGDNQLKINFAANARNDITVKGTFQYNMSQGIETSLQYSKES